MRIGFDLINIHLRGGGWRAVQQLIEGLATLDQENQYFLFANAEVADFFFGLPSNFHIRKANVPKRDLPWNQIYFALHRRQLRGIDLLHSPASMTPLLVGATKTVVTVHALYAKLFKHHYGLATLFYANTVYPRSLKKSAHIIVPSESLKQDIVKFYRISEDKITVIPHYISSCFLQASLEGVDSIKTRYGLPAQYILHAGLPYRQKNVEMLIKAFQIVKKGNVPHKLVLAGSKAPGIMAEIDRMGLKDEVIVTEYIPEHDLVLFYKGADVFVFPSVCEGFGYAPLEAMACGVPVVVSYTPSPPEVVGDAGLYIDPLNPEDIADKILQVLRSPDLAQELKERGLKRAQSFSMEKTISRHLEVYQRVCYGKKD